MLAHEGGLPLKFGFVGAGMMAGAMIRGLVKANVVAAPNIMASDAYQPSLDALSKELGIAVTLDNKEVARASDVVVIAVKPGQVQEVCLDISTGNPQALIVSIAAGVTIASMQSYTGIAAPKIVRVMPNTPACVGELAAAYAPNEHCSAADAAIVGAMLGALGTAFKVKEVDLDAVTGLSGSGPAYVFQFIEALSDGGVRAGLPRNVATALAAKTVKGAAEMVLVTGKHPAELKDQVTSPGGTTIAGVHALEQGGMRAAVINAVMAATERSKELGQGK
ncbi:pyrroline-5-carboxylate reductase [Pavlovales sp. CCMP2436]|nr:pyrroline-5-carboxylate reductase [Pavlovales sp. CCMP2436]|mmetsp:Transcript_78/g.199  ORF Transcript_78/g.199 Transcript_78/m.199 type:complete len:278 (+) Transcript_78:190-1023(+)